MSDAPMARPIGQVSPELHELLWLLWHQMAREQVWYSGLELANGQKVVIVRELPRAARVDVEITSAGFKVRI